MEAKRKHPSLLELSIRTAIDNLQHLTSVDGVDTQLLRRILPHCTLDQLARIESHTQTDLTLVTDACGKGSTSASSARNTRVMSSAGCGGYRWKELFRAKTEKQKDVVDQMVEALTTKFWEKNAEKQSKRTKLVTKVPPPSRGKRKSYFGPGSGMSSSSYKNPMIKKARMEVDSQARMQTAAVHRRPTGHGQTTRMTVVNRPNLNH